MRQLTPLAELPNTLENWGDIAWRLEAGPYIDTERIGLDVPGMQRLISAAGLKAAIVSGYQGEQSRIQINSTSVTGINLDGSATGAGSASVVKATSQQTDLHHNNEIFAFRWPIGDIGINRPEVAGRVGEDRRRDPNLSAEAAWARHVDRALRSGIVDLAVQGLVKDPWVHKRDSILLTDGIIGLNALSGNYIGASVLWGMAQGIPLLSQFIYDKTNPGHGIKWPPLKPSLLPGGFQPDRLAVAGAMAKTRRLIRPIA